MIDNGIGIEPEVRRARVPIFQRLHGRDAYDGSGIGLALSARSSSTTAGASGSDTDRAGRHELPLHPVREWRMRSVMNAHPVNVLLVEDDPGDVLIARRRLPNAASSTRLDVVGDGVEAIATCAATGDYAGRGPPI